MTLLDHDYHAPTAAMDEAHQEWPLFEGLSDKVMLAQVHCGHCKDAGTTAYHSVTEVFVCAMRSQQPGFSFQPTFEEIDD